MKRALPAFSCGAGHESQQYAPQIGLGYIALNKLELKEATKIFEEVVKKEPENYLAQTFLGICFLLNKPKRKKGEKLIHEAMEKSSNPTIKNLGAISLEWAEKDLKKKEAPFFAARNTGEKAKNNFQPFPSYSLETQ